MEIIKEDISRPQDMKIVKKSKHDRTASYNMEDDKINTN